MTVLTDWRLAEALAIQRLFGDHGPRWIAERMGALAMAGDMAGLSRFERIAERYQELLTAPRS